MKKILIPIGILFLLLLLPLVGIFHPGFFATDDGNWMVIRLSAFYEALRQGQFPVRFLPRLNNGFGYPVADFLYPLFLYIGSGIHLFHIPFVLTIKLLFGISLVGSSIGCFLWLRKQFGDLAGFIGSAIYSLFPYHIWDITKRGSLGEVVALGIIPFIFWQIDAGNIGVTAFGIGLLILAHNTLALLFLPILFVYMVLLKKYKHAAFSTLLGLCLSAFFWIPALYDKQFTVFDKTPVAHFSSYFLSNNLYALIGIISFVVILLSVVFFLKKAEYRTAFFLVIVFLSLFLTTSASYSVWQIFRLGKYVQFPFRFLSVTVLGVGFLAAAAIAKRPRIQQYIIAGAFLVLLFISSWQYFFPKTYQYYPDTFYSTNQDSTTVQNEYMPIWVKKMPASSQKVQIANGLIENLEDKGSAVSFQTSASKSSQLTIATVYFPGWQVESDGELVAVAPQQQTGFITFPIPSGRHVVTAFFSETYIRLFADGISIVSIGVFCIFVIRYLAKRRKI